MLSCEYGMSTLENSTIQNESRTGIIYDASDAEILISDEIQNAEQKLIYLGDIIASTKEKLNAFQRKGNLTDTEQILVKEYEQEIQDRLSELHETSRRIQTLLGLSNSDLELLINSTEESEQNEENEDITNSDATSEVSSLSEAFISLGTLFNDSDTEDAVGYIQPDMNEVNQILETISEEEMLNEDAHEWIPVNSAVTGSLQCIEGKEKIIDIHARGQNVTVKATHDSDGGTPKIETVGEKRDFVDENEKLSKVQTFKEAETSFCKEDDHREAISLYDSGQIRNYSSRNVDYKSEDPEFVITDEIQGAERKLTYLGQQISFVKEKLNIFQEKGELTDAEQKQVDEYKAEIKSKIKELHKTSKRLQVLVGVSNSDLKHLIYSDEHAEFEGYDKSINNEEISIKSSVSKTSVHLGPLLNNDTSRVDEISSHFNPPDILENDVSNKLETISDGGGAVSEGFREWIAVNTVLPELKQHVKDTKRTNNYFSNEDLFPKVVICGSEGSDPKIIFCDKTNSTSDFPVIVTQLPYFLHKILSMKEKSLIEIENLQNKRYYLQQELSEKDHALEELLCKVNRLENELGLVSKKNMSLKEKVNTAHSMEKRSDKMENHVHDIHLDTQVEFSENEQCEEPSTASSDTVVNIDEISTDHLSYIKEQYNKILEEYTNREKELEILQGQMSEQNGDGHEVRELLASSETEMLELEGRLYALRTQTNEVTLYQEKVTQSEQNLISSKIMYFKVQDQAEKYRMLIKEHAQETEKYRKKYLKTQQATDELRRQIEVKETENNHIHNQVSMEVTLVQNQFQEQMQLLSTIPDAVNKLQLQVQEEEQQWCMAEFRRRELMHELYDAKQQMDYLCNEINEIQTRLQESKDEQKGLHKQLKDFEKENEDLQNDVSALKSNTDIMLSEYEMAEKNTKEKINEITQLSKKLETYSDDFAHELSRAKNQNEKTRIALQIKISQLDDDMLQHRTFAKVMEKDRDKVKMDLQSHINWLNEKNDEATIIIHNLETQLKSCHSNDNNFHNNYMSMAN